VEPPDHYDHHLARWVQRAVEVEAVARQDVAAVEPEQAAGLVQPGVAAHLPVLAVAVAELASAEP
jgi:hypothetical protein